MKAVSSSARRRKSRITPEAQAAIQAANNFGRMHARLLIGLRKHTGLSHEEIAARACISPATVRTHEAASPHALVLDDLRIYRFSIRPASAPAAAPHASRIHPIPPTSSPP